MDARRYVALFGMYVGALPDLSGPFDHGHDLCFAPVAAFVSSDKPEHVVRNANPRTVVRGVAGMQITAVLRDDAMWGGLALRKAQSPQMHPATAHWRTHDGGVGWLRVRSRGSLDAVALEDGLYIDVGERGATAEVFPDTSRISFNREPSSTDGRKMRFEPGELEVSLN
jgi:hypothetical protein